MENNRLNSGSKWVILSSPRPRIGVSRVTICQPLRIMKQRGVAKNTSVESDDNNNCNHNTEKITLWQQQMQLQYSNNNDIITITL